MVRGTLPHRGTGTPFPHTSGQPQGAGQGGSRHVGPFWAHAAGQEPDSVDWAQGHSRTGGLDAWEKQTGRWGWGWGGVWAPGPGLQSPSACMGEGRQESGGCWAEPAALRHCQGGRGGLRVWPGWRLGGRKQKVEEQEEREGTHQGVTLPVLIFIGHCRAGTCG